MSDRSTPRLIALPQMKDLMMEFHRVTRGRKPEHLIFFRDGVSEGQFKEVYYSEYSAVREACKEMGDPNSECELLATQGSAVPPSAPCLSLCKPAGSGDLSSHPCHPADAPPITFVVVQKRHHTRLFPMPQDQQNRDRSGNVLPGELRPVPAPAHAQRAEPAPAPAQAYVRAPH
jgi:eukaryotic translation initiation factor 2C